MKTPIEFHFVTPTGVPISNTEVEIQLLKSAFDVEDSGVLMPRLVTATTDTTGKVTVELWSTTTMYQVKVYDLESDASLYYKFYVPEPSVPGTVVRLQDIVVTSEMENTSIDQAILLQVLAARADAVAAQIAAAASATQAAAASTGVSGYADAAHDSMVAAGASELNAQTYASSASTSAGNAGTSASLAQTSATNAASSESVASAAATSATNQATIASTKASEANTSAGIASTKATEASASATSAASAKVAAETARDATLTAYQSFGDAYLGSKASSPTLDNQGDPLLGGALYFNTNPAGSGGGMKVYNGTSWVAAYVPLGDGLSVANNLSDLSNLATALANLGLNNVNNTSDANKPISTATQTALNAKASIASLAAVAFSGSYNDLSNTPAAYSLGIATGTVLGGVKSSSSILVDGAGVATATAASVGARASNWVPAWSDVTAKPTTLAGFGITDAQPALGFTPYNATNPANYITAAQAPVQSVNGATGAVTKTQLGINNVDNTSDANKPVSTAQAAADAAVQSAAATDATTKANAAQAAAIAASTPVNTALLRAGGTMSGAINYAPFVTLASAGTLNIGAAAGNNINVTGSVTITAFDSIAEGARRLLRFAAGLTLTHNATSLILPGAANIAISAGDIVEMLSLGGGNWVCVEYVPAGRTGTGSAVFSNGPTFTGTPSVSEITLTDAATIAWDASLGNVAKVTLGGNRTFGAPTNLKVGGFYSLAVIQDATGSRTGAWNAVFKFTANTAPTLTTTANARDLFTFRSDGTNLHEVGRSQGVV